MNANIDLLFHLTIPIDFLKKLKHYYYIPENRVHLIKPGGFIFLVSKLVIPKVLNYSGILLSISDTSIHTSNYKYELSEVNRKYHVFYRPKLTKLLSAMTLLNQIK